MADSLNHYTLQTRCTTSCHLRCQGIREVSSSLGRRRCARALCKCSVPPVQTRDTRVSSRMDMCCELAPWGQLILFVLGTLRRECCDCEPRDYQRWVGLPLCTLSRRDTHHYWHWGLEHTGDWMANTGDWSLTLRVDDGCQPWILCRWERPWLDMSRVPSVCTMYLYA